MKYWLLVAVIVDYCWKLLLLIKMFCDPRANIVTPKQKEFMNSSINNIFLHNYSNRTGTAAIQKENANKTGLNNSFLVPSSSKKPDLNESRLVNPTEIFKTEAVNYNTFKPFGSTTREKLFVYTGSVERVISWRSIFQNHFCYFIVIGQIITIQDGTIKMQKMLILRDKNKGPILQVVYYTSSTYINIEDFHLGQMLRCAGTMVGPNILSAHSIRAATDEEVDTLQRHCCVCDRAISHYLQS